MKIIFLVWITSMLGWCSNKTEPVPVLPMPETEKVEIKKETESQEMLTSSFDLKITEDPLKQIDLINQAFEGFKDL